MPNASRHEAESSAIVGSSVDHVILSFGAHQTQAHPEETSNAQVSANDRAYCFDEHGGRVSEQSSRSCTRPKGTEHIGELDVDHELAGLGALEDGRPGERPAYPFTTLIRYAIKGSPKGRLLLEEIYQAIQARYPFFTTAPSGWKNSVRHTLSLMTCFEKVPRLLTEPGKGSYWTVNDTMPHAKPSRIRIRKRKTRVDDDDGSSHDTPSSTPDTNSVEVEATEALNEVVNYQRAPPYEWAGEPPRRHSSYIRSNFNDQRVIYHTRSQELFRHEADTNYHDPESPYDHGHRTRSQPLLETPQEAYVSDSRSSWNDTPMKSASGRSQADNRPSGDPDVDHRLVLMSELEKLRNVIGRRQDIDKEWCRLMVERLRGTGLEF